jgi:transcriptional regulator with XRE-family HTH domain
VSADGCERCGARLPGAEGRPLTPNGAAVGAHADRTLCPTCHVTDTGSAPTPAPEQLEPAVWSWSDPAAAAALRSRQLGPIVRAYRRVQALTQEQLAQRLGYDKTYVSMIETGRRVVHDVPTRRHIAGVLGIPPHLLGVTDPQDTEHVAMLAFAESTIRLADLARAGGRAADAVNELWPLVARLEARAAEGHLEADTLAVLSQAWTSLGVCLGTVLPEQRLWVAARWTSKGVTAAEHLDDPDSLTRALAMHGNELRKSGQLTGAVSALDRAGATARHGHDRGVALALLARAAGETGDAARFTEAVTGLHELIESDGPAGPLVHPFTFREIRLRGLLDLGDVAGAVAVAGAAPDAGAPAAQWTVIERITFADLLLAIGDRSQAEELLIAAVDEAVRLRLPHQIERVIRIGGGGGSDEALHRAEAALSLLCARPILASSQ